MACNRSSHHWPSGPSEYCGSSTRDDRGIGEDKRSDSHEGIGSRYPQESDASYRNFHRDKVKKIKKIVGIENSIFNEKLTLYYNHTKYSSNPNVLSNMVRITRMAAVIPKDNQVKKEHQPLVNPHDNNRGPSIRMPIILYDCLFI